MDEIRLKFKITEFTEEAPYEKLPGPKIHLKPIPTEFVDTAYEIHDGQIWVYISNGYDTKIQVRRPILLDWNGEKLNEENEEIFTLEKGKDIRFILRVKDRNGLNTLPYDTLIIYLWISLKEGIEGMLQNLQL